MRRSTVSPILDCSLTAIGRALRFAAAGLALAVPQFARAQCDPNLLGLCAPTLEAQLLPFPDGDQLSLAQFGQTVAIHGAVAVVGAPVLVKNANWHGIVYVHRRGPGGWELEEALLHPEFPDEDGYGEEVAVHEDTIIATHRLSTEALVLRYSSDSWMQETSVAGRTAVWLDGGVLAVMTFNDIYIYLRSTGQWAFHAALPCPDCADSWFFGYANLAFSGDTLIAGSTGYHRAHVFVNLTGVPHAQAVLTASDGGSHGSFGSGVAIDGDTAIVGARTASVAGQPTTGAAYVFERSNSDWTETARLTTPDLQAGAGFGNAITFHRDVAFVGARNYDLPGESGVGAVFEYRRVGGQWVFQRRITAPDANPGDRFGHAIASDGSRLIVGALWAKGAGAFDGAAYIYKLPCVGDMNCDGTIGQADLAELLAAYGCTCCRDIDGDFDVDQADLAGLLAVYNQPCAD